MSIVLSCVVWLIHSKLRDMSKVVGAPSETDHELSWARFGFETWAVKQNLCINVHVSTGELNGQYIDPRVETAWNAWRYLQCDTK